MSLAEVAEWTIVADCKSAGRKAYPGSNPGLSTGSDFESKTDYLSIQRIVT